MSKRKRIVTGLSNRCDTRIDSKCIHKIFLSQKCALAVPPFLFLKKSSFCLLIFSLLATISKSSSNATIPRLLYKFGIGYESYSSAEAALELAKKSETKNRFMRGSQCRNHKKQRVPPKGMFLHSRWH